MLVRRRVYLLFVGLLACAAAACSGAREANSVLPHQGGEAAVRRSSQTQASSPGMCSVYGADGTVSFCYQMAEASGTTLVDSSSAGNNGTISTSGVTYHIAGLTTNSTYAESTNGTSGSLTSGFSPTSGSFSISFFTSLLQNHDEFDHLAATGNPSNSSPSSGWNIDVKENATNTVFAKIGYGSGQTTINGPALPLGTPVNVTLTYNSSTNVATLCVGGSSSPSCANATLPAAYVASGNPVVFGGGNAYPTHPANATFDEAGYWQGTVLNPAQIDAIAGYAGAATGPGMCSVYAADGALSGCYLMDEASGTTLVDSSSAASNGTIAASGVAYHATGLTTNDTYAETTNGSTGSMTSGFSPASGSFSVSFFTSLLKNQDEFDHLAATGSPSNSSPSNGWNIDISNNSSNSVFAKIGTGSGQTTIDGPALPLNTPTNVTLTYNASTLVATLCVGSTSSPSCTSAILPAAYVAAGKPIVFGGGSAYSTHPANAIFDNVAYWAGTVLTSAQIDTIAGYAGPTSQPTPTPVPTKFNVTTYHYDDLRTGWNQEEHSLTQAAVGSANFGQLARVSLDDQVDAQPLLVTNLSIAGGTHDVVYVATENNTVYAIDASSGSVLLSRNLGTPVPESDFPGQCNNNSTEVGITGTPVIDLPSQTMYLITYTYESSVPVYRIHALSLTTLADEVGSGVVITASAMLSDGSTYTFQPAYGRQRPALLEANGNVYAGFGSWCDLAAAQTRGWVLGWRTGSLTPLPSNDLTDGLATSPNTYFLTSIWMSGYGPSADSSGDVYFVTGNSDPGSYHPPTNLQESVVQENGNLSGVLGYFSPSDGSHSVSSLDGEDGDFGSGGALLLPDQTGSVKHLLAAAGKNGIMYLLNRDNLGGNNTSAALGTYSIGNCYCGLAYFVGQDGNQRIVSSGNSTVILWQISGTSLVRGNASATLATGQDPGFFTSISSNGTQAGSGIIWAVARPQHDNNPTVTLYAFNATSLATIFSATVGTWVNTSGNANIVPVVANGKVYVASYKELAIYGLK